MKMTFNLAHLDIDQVKRQVEYMVKNLKDADCQYDIIIKKHESIRRIKQNSFYWAIVSELADETGNDKDFIHAYFKRKFLAHYVRFNGSKFLEISSTSKLTIKAFSEYVEKVIAHILTDIDPDFKIPDPNDYY